ncbi:MAG: reverse transcriptase family protein [Lachnospiraceae bacterium]|nr:reverse transcriptase family protein [Lachnospiraceae bacterium]
MKNWKIKSEDKFLSLIVNCQKEDLKRVLMDKSQYYGDEVLIPKKRGVRTIYNIDKEHPLYKIQKSVVNNFLNNIRVSDAACGFVKKTSYYDFLEPHTDFYCKNNYLRLDLKDFFGTITKSMVYDALEFYCQIDDKDEKERVLNYLSDILTYNDVVVQGCIPSPMISNIVFRKVDIRIQRYCNTCNAKYTRYADDLLFSGRDERILKNSFCKGISKIVQDNGFEINYDKKIKGKGYISLNGFVVSDSITLSRKKLEEINRIVFYLKGNKERLRKIKNGDVSELNEHIKNETGVENKFSGKYQVTNYLNGYRAFLISIIKKTENKKFMGKVKNIIINIEYCVDKIIV